MRDFFEIMADFALILLALAVLLAVLGWAR